MDRRKFFKRFGTGSAMAVVAPAIAGSMIIDIPDDHDPCLIYDLASIPDRHPRIGMEDILRIWKEHGILLYDGNLGSKPILLHNKENVELIDVSSCPPRATKL